jgi:hypothetical protein
MSGFELTVQYIFFFDSVGCTGAVTYADYETRSLVLRFAFKLRFKCLTYTRLLFIASQMDIFY